MLPLLSDASKVPSEVLMALDWAKSGCGGGVKAQLPETSHPLLPLHFVDTDGPAANATRLLMGTWARFRSAA